MEVEISGTDTVAVAAVSGRIDAYTAPDVEEQLQAAVSDGRHLVVDLTATDYVSSAGLRVLLTLAKRSARGDFQMRLSGLQEAVREVFDIAGFSRLFEVRDTPAEALAELSGS
ncbi:MAG: STAS domain-containing protein [Armatimonadetes bacterium]|nr:STAS domain-containing protein [Armatimonadota bacterium]